MRARALDHREVELVRSILGKPWIAMIFSYFYELFILWFRLPFFPFGCEVGLSCFIVSAPFLFLFLVAVYLEVEN